MEVVDWEGGTQVGWTWGRFRRDLDFVLLGKMDGTGLLFWGVNDANNASIHAQNKYNQKMYATTAGWRFFPRIFSFSGFKHRDKARVSILITAGASDFMSWVMPIYLLGAKRASYFHEQPIYVTFSMFHVFSAVIHIWRWYFRDDSHLGCAHSHE